MDKLEREALEKANKQSGNVSPAFQIRKLLRDKDEKTNLDMVYCVADGMNMEYRFTLFEGEKVIFETPYSRPNSLDLTRFSEMKFTACRVDVKGYLPGGPQEVNRVLPL
ncbi:hypothetical protein [Corynebacterium glutamicum]|uniref:hypothetical protein n=1 Tax=Corynebacterium glutamicum TaxID=1718 RepID=UPI00117892BA|nr:hypothetical protein [Corynebacterium glutamicum]